MRQAEAYNTPLPDAGYSAHMNRYRQLYSFIKLGRPFFLLGGFVLHGLGIAIALYSGSRLNLQALFWGQVCITATQWMTHYSNDYFDLKADSANLTPTQWSGGSRILPDSQLSPVIALIAAIALAISALTSAFILAFGIQKGALTLPLLLVALFLAWFYSAPPLRLHSRGLGEISTALLVGGLTPLTGFYLQTGYLAPVPVLTVIPLIGLQFCMLLTIEFPDAVGDQLSGKRTLVVRLGTQRAIRLHRVILSLVYLALPLLLLAGLPPLVVLSIVLLFPLVIWRLWQDENNPASWNKMGFISIALLISTAGLEMITFILLIG